MPSASSTTRVIGILSAADPGNRDTGPGTHGQDANDRPGDSVHDWDLKDRRVVLAHSGGKVNAAMAATLLVEQFRRPVLFTGIAGGPNPDLRPAMS